VPSPWSPQSVFARTMVADENTCPNHAAPDMFFVPQKEFEALRSKLKKGSTITQKDADALVNWTGKNSDIVIPVDMNGAGENLDDFDAALKKLGATKTVECFVKAFEQFEGNKHKIPEAERAKPMTAKQWKVENDEDDEDAEDEEPVYVPDLFHLPKAAFEALKVQLTKKQDISKQDADALVNWTMPDSEVLVPVDMNGAEEDLDDFDEMLEKLGPKAILENFVQAEKHLEKKRSLIPAQKLKLITIKQWKEGGYEEDGSADEREAEAEAAENEDEEENSDEDEDEEEEPASKKAKTV